MDIAGGIILAALISFLGGIIVGLLVKSFKVAKINKENLTKYYYEIEQLNEKIEEKQQEVEEANRQLLIRLSQMNEAVKQETAIVETLVEQEKERAYEAFSAYVDTLQFSYQETEEEFDEKINLLKQELDKMKATRAASMQAILREQELKEKETFYKICLSTDELSDITILEGIKPQLRRPEVLSKLIWTTYYQKPLTILCNNILGDKMKSGIYKITDSVSGLIYIGQSVNISNRWKDHVKAALGAGTTISDNKLYRAMKEHGVHNFTFEILESIPPERLNEAEKRYIEFYQSNIYGLNVVRGTG